MQKGRVVASVRTWIDLSDRRAGIICITIGGAFMAVMAVLIFSTRNVLGYLYSQDPEVRSDAAVRSEIFKRGDALCVRAAPRR